MPIVVPRRECDRQARRRAKDAAAEYHDLRIEQASPDSPPPSPELDRIVEHLAGDRIAPIVRGEDRSRVEWVSVSAEVRYS